MRQISNATLEALRLQYPQGTRVKLVHMDDPFNTRLVPGCLGTVRHVDDMGTIHISWDCGSSLGAVYGEDVVAKVSEPSTKEEQE